MDIYVAANALELGQQAAEDAARTLQGILEEQGYARLVVATGASQFHLFEHLTRNREVDWSRVEGFHLDEYVGLSCEHPASFVRYLQERFVSQVPLKAFYFLDGSTEPSDLCQKASAAISLAPIDLLLCGIGENGHLAFNDPPADFQTEAPYLQVVLDEACRKQQVGEGWFPALEKVPSMAISMSIRQILSAKQIICSVPDQRKAQAVWRTLEEAISPTIPASALRTHPQCRLYLDAASASSLSWPGPACRERSYPLATMPRGAG